MTESTKPSPIWVFVTVTPNDRNGLKKEFTARVGAAKTEPEALKLIVDDLAAMNDTFGGLVEPVSKKGRKYRAFRAEWTEIKL